jgi:hypothetical protein
MRPDRRDAIYGHKSKLKSKIRPRFLILSHPRKDCFHICEVDSTDALSVVNALDMSSEAQIVALPSNQSKRRRLKLADPIAILKEARA